jgi:hypothetical protein
MLYSYRTGCRAFPVEIWSRKLFLGVPNQVQYSALEPLVPRKHASNQKPSSRVWRRAWSSTDECSRMHQVRSSVRVCAGRDACTRFAKRASQRRRFTRADRFAKTALDTEPSSGSPAPSSRRNAQKRRGSPPPPPAPSRRTQNTPGGTGAVSAISPGRGLGPLFLFPKRPRERRGRPLVPPKGAQRKPHLRHVPASGGGNHTHRQGRPAPALCQAKAPIFTGLLPGR